MVKELYLVPSRSRPPTLVGNPRCATTLPPLPSPCVERSYLSARILPTAGVHVLIAPLGFGKTTLLLQLASRARSDGQSVAWLTLSSNEREGEQLLRALERAFGFEPMSCGDCVATLIARIEAVPRAALYVDNLEELSGGESVPIIRELIEGLRTSQLFVAGREFAAIVIGGLRRDKGMPVFAGQITPEELQTLQAFILDQAWKAYEKQNVQPSNTDRLSP